MSNNFSTDVTIDAPITAVWDTLADIGTIARWNPGVQESHTTTEQTEGVGACRYCDLGGKNFLDEKVVIWEPNERLTMRVTNTNMPFQSVDIHFYLQENGAGTKVTVAPEYTLKYGVVGRLLDTLFVHNTYKKGMGSLLGGLKEYVEAQ
ncbi:MAG: SRPBCC family protein [Chloroflexota bacterium]